MADGVYWISPDDYRKWPTYYKNFGWVWPEQQVYIPWGTPSFNPITFTGDDVTQQLAFQVVTELDQLGLWDHIGLTRENIGAIIQTFAMGIYGFNPGDTSFSETALEAIRFHFTYERDPAAAAAVVKQSGIVNPNAAAEINAVTGGISGGYSFDPGHSYNYTPPPPPELPPPGDLPDIRDPRWENPPPPPTSPYPQPPPTPSPTDPIWVTPIWGDPPPEPRTDPWGMPIMPFYQGYEWFGDEFGGLTATLADQVIDILRRAGIAQYIGLSKENIGAIIQTFAQARYGFMGGDTRFSDETLSHILFHFTYERTVETAKMASQMVGGLVNPNAANEINAITGGISGGYTFELDPRIYTPPDYPGVVDPGPQEPNVDFYELAQLWFPWIVGKPELLDAWVEAYIENGQNGTLARAAMRADPSYDRYFAGNKREDGTVRMDESVYDSTIEGYKYVLTEAQLNPDLFEARFVDLIEGNTSVTEFRDRVSMVQTRIFDNIDEVRSTFGEFYDIGALDDTMFVAAALDPSIGDDILNRRIDIAQVAATGRHAGFAVGQQLATRLVNRGFDQYTATGSVYDPARAMLPSLNRAAGRFDSGDRTFGFGEFVEAAGFSDPYQVRRIRRLGQHENSLFTSRARQVGQRAGRLSGLQER